MDEEKKETLRQKVNRTKAIMRTQIEVALSKALSALPDADALPFLSIAQSVHYTCRAPKAGSLGSVIASVNDLKRAGICVRYVPSTDPKDPTKAAAIETTHENEVNAWVAKVVKFAVERKKEIEKSNREIGVVHHLADTIGADRASLASFIRYHEADPDDPENEDIWTLRAVHGYIYPSIRPHAVETLARALVAAGIVKTPAEVAAEKLAEEQRRKIESVCSLMYGMRQGKPARFSDDEARAALEAHGWDVKATWASLLPAKSGETKAG